MVREDLNDGDIHPSMVMVVCDFLSEWKENCLQVWQFNSLVFASSDKGDFS